MDEPDRSTGQGVDEFDGAVKAEPSGTMVTAVCWECGQELLCREYVVCCTGTVFHICPDCEARLDSNDEVESA
jgi:hypothetical protein